MRGKHPNFIYNVDDDHAREMKAQGLGATAIAKALGIGQASVLAGVRNQLR
jgi:predicted transcriptional regulator